jgi:hypothetical protein
MTIEPETITPAEECREDSCTMRVIAWFSVGVAVAALGVCLGAELRNRYKFQHRTPYDFYANAGKHQVSEFGVGV